MSYEDLLKRAMNGLPEVFKNAHRFEIPRVESKQVGNKTVIDNFKTIANKINRSEEVLAKYFLNEAGTSGYIENRTLVLHGKFPPDFLNQKFAEYCKKYVICEKCNRPDTLHIKKDVIKCEACGHTRPI